MPVHIIFDIIISHYIVCGWEEDACWYYLPHLSNVGKEEVDESCQVFPARIGKYLYNRNMIYILKKYFVLKRSWQLKLGIEEEVG